MRISSRHPCRTSPRAASIVRERTPSSSSEVGRRAEEQRREQRWSHHNVGHRQAPSTGLACNAANVKAEAHNAVGKREKREPPHPRLRGAPRKDRGEARDCECARKQHGRVHYRVGVAAAVVLVADLHRADRAGARNHESERPLKDAVLHVTQNEFRRLAQRRRDQLDHGSRRRVLWQQVQAFFPVP